MFILRENFVKELVGIFVISFLSIVRMKTVVSSMKCSYKLIWIELELLDSPERYNTLKQWYSAFIYCEDNVPSRLDQGKQQLVDPSVLKRLRISRLPIYDCL